jgi:hypothetical protein
LVFKKCRHLHSKHNDFWREPKFLNRSLYNTIVCTHTYTCLRDLHIIFIP